MASKISLTLKHPGVRWIAFGWSGFILENLILSENRDKIIQHYGKDNYHYIYNTLSSVACLSIGWGLLKHGYRKGPTIGSARGMLSRSIACCLQGVGLIGFSQLIPKLQIPVVLKGVDISADQLSTSNIETVLKGASFNVRCPMDFRSRESTVGSIYGSERVTRHPMLWSLGLFGLGHAFRTIYITEIVMGSFPFIFAYIGGAHQDSRYRRGMGGHFSLEEEETTSHIPFMALIQGSQSWGTLANEIKWTNAGLAALIALRLLAKKIKK